jgi:hypothetical protein
MKHRGKLASGENLSYKAFVANIAVDAPEGRVLVLVGHHIDVGDGESFRKQVPFENSTEKPASPRNQNLRHSSTQPTGWRISWLTSWNGTDPKRKAVNPSR